MSEIRLVVGLGNPGLEYAGTRHNMGFMAVRRLLEKLNGGIVSASRYESSIFEARVSGRKLWLQLPETFMNRSGEAVRKLMTATGIEPGELLVVYDDMDIPFGRLRLRESGSSGGHRGMESIILELGSERFNRLRIGIGDTEKSKVVDFVLSEFAVEDSEKLRDVLNVSADTVKLALIRGVKEAMNKYNNWELETKEQKQAGN